MANTTASRESASPDPSKVTSLMESLKNLKKSALETHKVMQKEKFDDSIQGAVYSAVFLTGVRIKLEEKIAKPFEALIKEAKELFPNNERIQNFNQHFKLTLKTLGSALDVYDIPRIKELFLIAANDADKFVALIVKADQDPTLFQRILRAYP